MEARWSSSPHNYFGDGSRALDKEEDRQKYNYIAPPAMSFSPNGNNDAMTFAVKTSCTPATSRCITSDTTQQVVDGFACTYSEATVAACGIRSSAVLGASSSAEVVMLVTVSKWVLW
ncbi:hypothetical protein MKX07_005027 [Trichoderma sp. CBMAI-0711]|nr:hypothetical protein MKX07_005027 [Trichoderma sp. CBMAI-0711]